MNIGLVTLYTPELMTNEFISKKLPNFRNYAVKHDYETFEFKNQLDKNRDPQWSKIKAVYKVLDNTDCDWTFWCDADTLFLDQDKSIEHYIDEEYDLIFCSDLFKTLWVNTGAFLAKNTKWTKNFLKKVYHDDNFYVNNKRHFDHEQGSLRKLLYKDRREDNIKIIESEDSDIRFQNFWQVNDPEIIINSESNEYFKMSEMREELIYSKGDFMVHFAGCNNKDFLIKSFCDMKEKN